MDIKIFGIISLVVGVISSHIPAQNVSYADSKDVELGRLNRPIFLDRFLGLKNLL